MKKPPLELLPGTILILPTAALVSDFLDRMKKFADKSKHKAFALALTHGPALSETDYQGINPSSVADLAVAMFSDILEGMSAWVTIAGCQQDSATEKQWAKMVMGWNENIDGRTRQSLFTRVEEDMFDVIHDWVVSFDNVTPSWNVWYVRRMGHDVVVEKGQDYRILDWTRRMEAGAEYLKDQEEGSSLPAEAWVPDAECRRFTELMLMQQRAPSPIARSKLDSAKAGFRNKIQQYRRIPPKGKL